MQPPKNKPDQSKTRSRIISKVFKILIIAVVLFVVLVIYLVVAGRVQAKKDKRDQVRKFEQATQLCGKNPIVVTAYNSRAIEVYTDYSMYTPQHPGYEYYKTIHESNAFGDSTQVVGYYCSIEKAKQANPSLKDNALNYSSDEKPM